MQLFVLKVNLQTKHLFNVPLKHSFLIIPLSCILLLIGIFIIISTPILTPY